MEINFITGIVLDACIKIHRKIGPGCFERVSEEVLSYELYHKGLHIQRQVLMPIAYEKLLVEHAYRIDLLLERRIVMEGKSLECIAPVHFNKY